MGLAATWSMEFGYVSIHDPTEGEWWDVPTKDAPAWALPEAIRYLEEGHVQGKVVITV
jgi:hypothetical protein